MHFNICGNRMWARGGRVDQHYWNALWKWNWEIKGSNCKWIPPFFRKRKQICTLTQAHLIHVNASKRLSLLILRLTRSP